MLTRDKDIAILSVLPSVRHISVLYENGLTYCHNFFTTVARSFYFCEYQTFSRNVISTESIIPCEGAKQRGVNNFAIFDQ